MRNFIRKYIFCFDSRYKWKLSEKYFVKSVLVMNCLNNERFVRRIEPSPKGIKECTKFVKISTIAVQSRYKFCQCHKTSWNKKEDNENLRISLLSSFELVFSYGRKKCVNSWNGSIIQECFCSAFCLVVETNKLHNDFDLLLFKSLQT